MFSGLLDVLFPPTCASCARLLDTGAPFCGDCGLSLEEIGPGCRICSEPGPEGTLCPRCRTQLPPFSRAWAPFCHGGAIARAIHLYKYEDRPELARPLAQLLRRAASEFLAAAPTNICAVPLHFTRYLARRYDQAELLARELSALTPGARHVPALRRTRRTSRQVGQDEHAREQNVEGAFVADASVVAGRRILLIDDVYTTGATARACVLALRSAGATEVQVLTLARA